MTPAIGRLALPPMDVKTVDVESVFRDFRECLNTFDDWASSFWSFSALDVEQVFKVGDEVALVAPINRSLYPSSIVATCQANGKLTLVHIFQSAQYISQTELDELLKLGKNSIAHGLLVLSDEPLMFIYLSAISSWIRMLSRRC